jgi:hypothetical protein
MSIFNILQCPINDNSKHETTEKECIHMQVTAQNETVSCGKREYKNLYYGTANWTFTPGLSV